MLARQLRSLCFGNRGSSKCLYLSRFWRCVNPIAVLHGERGGVRGTKEPVQKQLLHRESKGHMAQQEMTCDRLNSSWALTDRPAPHPNPLSRSRMYPTSAA